ncbi:Uncharacterised protein [Mycobacteroides abscessus subsp. abscessus]|uniref:hypothetical protein n=1 Tax=Mycobacteroides abscessus TaxID=36809 RepID=UPI000928699E|nr:hypothetical protein [Mycobacteroides abscessus]SIJ03828.1 Uncharacterised protein [Mycobacteroides abscessus subsp. abscessus]SIN15392.1 Uncharacterised protein [Mycobacteroides abscessus subsp. abscessus]
MTQLFLPDNTVLINFAIIGRMDLLAGLLNGRGCWCLSIARECANSQPYQPDLSQAPAIFGPPLIPDRAEHAEALILRDNMATPGDPTTKHRGEAETIAIITRRRINGFFLTDDRDATELAIRHGIKVVTTWDLLRLAYKVNKVTKPALTGYLRTLKSQRRGQPPTVTNPEQLDDWL